MTADGSKSYLSYLNKLEDQYNNAYYHYINKKSINADQSAFIEKLGVILKLLSSKLMIVPELLSIRIFFSEVFAENWSAEIFMIDSVLKNNSWTYKIKC